MMRKIHRWFGLITGIFMAVIAFTGVAMQLSDLAGGGERRGPPQMQMTQGQAGGQPGPMTMQMAPQRPQGEGGRRGFRQLMNQIHRGRYFGAAGVYISILCGVALFFFSLSGIWMYAQMFTSRASLGKKQIFW